MKQNEFIRNLLIIPQSKAAIRGNIFNKEVANEFKSILPKTAKILPEYKHSNYAEILDLYIECNDKVLCVFNQLDLWNGGEQLNRCDKYLSKPNNELLCVVLNEPTFTTKSKAYKLISANHGSHVIWFSEIHEFCYKYFDLK